MDYKSILVVHLILNDGCHWLCQLLVCAYRHLAIALTDTGRASGTQNHNFSLDGILVDNQSYFVDVGASVQLSPQLNSHD